MRLGVDLGTTWTAAAVDATTGPEAVQLADRTIAMPSVVAVADGTVLVGEAAEAHLAGQPASGTREFKRRLGDSTPYVLAGIPFGAEALMGHLLRHAVERAEAQVGETADTVALTHPANWGEFKLDLLREVARIADVDDRLELQPEPVAAVRHHLALGGVRPGQTLAAFDFGGGTVDVAVVRATDGGIEVLGSPEGLERLGGVDVDQIVLAHVDAVLDGQLRELDTTDPAVRRAIAQLRSRCTAAKEALSAETETTVAVQVPGLDTQVRLSRAELESALRPRLDDAVAALRRAATGADVDPADLDAVVLVGGSSRIPLVAEMISSSIGAPVVPGADPQLAIAAGAATSSTTERSPAPSEEAETGAASEAPTAEPGRRTTSTDRAATSGLDRSALRRLVTGGAMTASAAAASVGGYLAYQRWWDDDDEPGIADLLAGAAPTDVETLDDLTVEDAEAFAAAVEDVADGLLSGAGAVDPLDAFDAFDGATNLVGGPAGPVQVSATGLPPAPSSTSFTAATSASSEPAPTATPFSAPPRPTSVGTTASPSAPPPPRTAPSTLPSSPPPRPEPAPPPGPAPTPPIFTDPELESVRAQLRERLGALELPEGTDPADAERLRRDLDGLLDRYRAAPGQSVDEAVATLRYEFEDRMRDFAQDQRIDALIEQARTDDQEAADEPTPDPVEDVADDGAASDPPSTEDEAAEDGPVVADVFDEIAEDVPGADDARPAPADLDDDRSVAEVDEERSEPVEDELPAASDVDDDLEDDILGTGATDPPMETEPLVLTAPGVGVPEAIADDVQPDAGRLTKDLIPEVVGESAEPAPADDDATFHTAIVPGGEFLDPADVEPAPEPVAAEAPTDDDPLDSPLGV